MASRDTESTAFEQNNKATVFIEKPKNKKNDSVLQVFENKIFRRRSRTRKFYEFFVKKKSQCTLWSGQSDFVKVLCQIRVFVSVSSVCDDNFLLEIAQFVANR